MNNIPNCLQHTDMILSFICMEKSCVDKCLACFYCLQDYHSNHANSCHNIEDQMYAEESQQFEGENTLLCPLNISDHIKTISQLYDSLSDIAALEIQNATSQLKQNINFQVQQTNEISQIQMLQEKKSQLNLKIQKLYEQETQQKGFSKQVEQLVQEYDEIKLEIQEKIQQLQTRDISLDVEINLIKDQSIKIIQDLDKVSIGGMMFKFELPQDTPTTYHLKLSEDQTRVLFQPLDAISFCYSYFQIKYPKIYEGKIKINGYSGLNDKLSIGLAQEKNLLYKTFLNDKRRIIFRVFNSNNNTDFYKQIGKLPPSQDFKDFPLILNFKVDFIGKYFRIFSNDQKFVWEYGLKKKGGRTCKFFKIDQTYRLYVSADQAEADIQILE